MDTTTPDQPNKLRNWLITVAVLTAISIITALVYKYTGVQVNLPDIPVPVSAKS